MTIKKKKISMMTIKKKKDNNDDDYPVSVFLLFFFFSFSLSFDNSFPPPLLAISYKMKMIKIIVLVADIISF